MADGTQHLNLSSKRASDTRLIPFSCLHDYWAKRISAILQKGQAHTIVDKSRTNLDERACVTLSGYVATDEDSYSNKIH